MDFGAEARKRDGMRDVGGCMYGLCSMGSSIHTVAWYGLEVEGGKGGGGSVGCGGFVEEVG